MTAYHGPLGGRNTSNHYSADLRTALRVALGRDKPGRELEALGCRVASDLLNIKNWQNVQGIGPKINDKIVEFLWSL
jgi:hypothetical protein